MRIISARGLPSEPIDAAGEFLSRVVPEVRATIRLGQLPACIVFDPADHTHTAWRMASVQSLAREAAPGRINAVVGAADTVAAAAAYLARAPGVTGQYLPLDGNAAGNPAL
jgi:hypothetical protein